MIPKHQRHIDSLPADPEAFVFRSVRFSCHHLFYISRIIQRRIHGDRKNSISCHKNLCFHRKPRRPPSPCKGRTKHAGVKYHRRRITGSHLSFSAFRRSSQCGSERAAYCPFRRHRSDPHSDNACNGRSPRKRSSTPPSGCRPHPDRSGFRSSRNSSSNCTFFSPDRNAFL